MIDSDCEEFIRVTPALYAGPCEGHRCRKRAEKQITIISPIQDNTSGFFCDNCGDIRIDALCQIVHILARRETCPR